jgi:hypothetical protein
MSGWAGLIRAQRLARGQSRILGSHHATVKKTKDDVLYFCATVFQHFPTFSYTSQHLPAAKIEQAGLSP